MKLKTNNIFYSILIFSNLMFISTKALSLSNDNNQLIYIDSAEQSIDMSTNTITLNGKVFIQRGSINIRADKIIITRPNRISSREIIEGYGKPVVFYQMHNDGNIVRGHSKKVLYETEKNLITLTGDAYLEKQGNNVKSDCIIYLINKQRIQAFSVNGRRVTTVLTVKKMQDQIDSTVSSKSIK